MFKNEFKSDEFLLLIDDIQQISHSIATATVQIKEKATQSLQVNSECFEDVLKLSTWASKQTIKMLQILRKIKQISQFKTSQHLIQTSFREMNENNCDNILSIISKEQQKLRKFYDLDQKVQLLEVCSTWETGVRKNIAKKADINWIAGLYDIESVVKLNKQWLVRFAKKRNCYVRVKDMVQIWKTSLFDFLFT